MKQCQGHTAKPYAKTRVAHEAGLRNSHMSKHWKSDLETRAASLVSVPFWCKVVAGALPLRASRPFRSHPLLRRLSPLLGAPTSPSQTPQLPPWSTFDPASIHTVALASCVHSLPFDHDGRFL